MDTGASGRKGFYGFQGDEYETLFLYATRVANLKMCNIKSPILYSNPVASKAKLNFEW